MAKATFSEGSYVFLQDDAECYVPAKVNATFTQGKPGSVSVVGEGSGAKQAYRQLSEKESDAALPMDPQSLESIDNMVDLKQLNDASILQNLRLRFKDDTVYTAIGTILVSINPFKMLPLYTPEVLNEYIKKGSRRLPPHIYGVSDLAYRNMADGGMDQACIVSGESGAGKTEATKLFLSYIAEMSSRRSAGTADSSTVGENANASAADKNVSSLQDRILEANPLMEAFGNAKTSRNDNSSRFGKWIGVDFNGKTGAVTGASITDYLLEKSRIVHQMEGERNYHIFYQLCAAANVDSEMRDKLKVSDPSSFYYLSQSSVIEVPSINDSREWQHTLRAMEVVNITDKVEDLTRTLAGILHLGNVQFEGGESAKISNPDVLKFAAELFGTSAETLDQSLCKRSMSNAQETVFKDNSEKGAAAVRDAFAKQTYGMLFSWLIKCINEALGGGKNNASSKRLIGVLDIFGFESFDSNSFEQLCINYCNEKLQGYFNEHIFKLEQEEYKREGVDVSKIEFFDNGPVLDAIERKQKGVFSLIDEEINIPKGSDEGYLGKVLELQKSDKDVVKAPNVKDVRANAQLKNVFIVHHYAGEVGYDVTGFLDKTKDALPEDMEEVGVKSKHPFLQQLFKESKAAATAAAGGGGAKASARKTMAAKKTLGTKFKEQLTKLMKTLQATEPHFVRCIKPNSEKLGDKFTSTMVLDQLRYSGLLEVCRIRQLGYPVRREFGEFVHRYAPLCDKNVKRDVDSVIESLKKKDLLKGSDWQKGNSKVFIRTELFNKLELAREEALRSSVVAVQRLARGFIARRRAKNWKEVIKSLQAATKAGDENSLQNALLEAGSLPYQGRHLKATKEAKAALEKLKEIQRAEAMVTKAMKTNDYESIESAIKSAKAAGAKDNSAVMKEAKARVDTLKQQQQCKDALKKATKERNLKGLTDALATAKKLGMAESGEAKEAEAVRGRLDKVEKTAAELEKATSKKDDKKIGSLLQAMAELGAKDHPSVAAAQKVSNQIAEVSAKLARRIAKVKSDLEEAASEKDLDKLESLEVEAQELGIAEDPAVLKAMEVADSLALERKLSAMLDTAISSVENKAESANGLAKEDISSLTSAIATAKKMGATKESEALQRAQDCESRVKKQIDVQSELDAALQSLDADALKAAVDKASELGIQSDSARRAQVELHKMESTRKTGAAPGARKSVRRTSVSAAAAAASKKFRERKKGAAAGDAPPELKIPTDKEMEKNYADRIAKANSKAFSSRLFRAMGSNFHFSRYLRVRSPSDFTRLEPKNRKANRSRLMLRHQHLPISMSLLMLKPHLNETAIGIFDAILGFCGDKPAQFPESLAQYVLRKGLEEPRLVDEIYMQLLKQLTENKGAESLDRCWLLMCLAVQSFPPTKEFEAFLLNFFVLHRGAPALIGNYARWCIFQVGASEKMGPSPFLPQTSDIELYMKRPPVMVKVHQMFRTVDHRMTWTEIPVWPCHDVAWAQKLVAEQSKIPTKTADICALFVKDIEANWAPRPTGGDSTPRPPGAPAQTKKKGLASVSISAVKSIMAQAQSFMKSLATVGREPPEPIAPWPLPHSVFLGDVVSRMSQQGRVPVFTYQRKIFLDAEVSKPDKAMFLQCLMSVVHGHLPIPNEAEVVELAVIALATRNQGPFPDTAEKLVMAGIFNFVPVMWCEGRSESYWTNAVLSFIKGPGASLVKQKEDKLAARYVQICARSPLFGSSLFSVMRKEQENKDFYCAVNRGGVHVLDAGTFQIIGTIPYNGIEKFGASATYVWFTVTPTVVKQVPNLFPADQFGNENAGVLFLHSNQAAECYHVVYDQAYFTAHGKVKPI